MVILYLQFILQESCIIEQIQPDFRLWARHMLGLEATEMNKNNYLHLRISQSQTTSCFLLELPYSPTFVQFSDFIEAPGLLPSKGNGAEWERGEKKHLLLDCSLLVNILQTLKR